MIIDGIEYIKKEELNSNVKIVILQRGWVMVGYFARNGSDCRLTKASVIRSWGTTKGLGELINGPLENTKLDKCGTVEFDYLTVAAIINCEDSKWANVL